MVYQESLDPLSITFAALADPTRRSILSMLKAGEWSVKELARPFAMSLPAVSKHLKVLEKAGLITKGRSAQWRPCRLRAEPLQQADEWIERYREHWEARLDRLDNYLKHLQAEETAPAKGQAALRGDRETKKEAKKEKKI